MSAFVVSEKHLDAMIQYAFTYGRRDGFGWSLPGKLPSTCYQRGEPWGRASIAVGQERRCELLPETASRIGLMLWTENCISVDHRYNENSDPITYEWTTSKTVYTKIVSAVECLKLIDCYEYQTCEHPEWNESEAKVFCGALRKLAIRNLPGYESAKWGL